MLQELKQAAQQRLESVRAPQPRAVSEVERVLLCALVLPEADSARALAATTLGAHPLWFAELPTAAVIEALVDAPCPENPFEAAPDESSRAMLASALHVSSEVAGPEHELSPEAVRGALRSLQESYLERRSREVRAQLSEASRRADQEALQRLTREKFELLREQRAFDNESAA